MLAFKICNNMKLLFSYYCIFSIYPDLDLISAKFVGG